MTRRRPYAAAATLDAWRQFALLTVVAVVAMFAGGGCAAGKPAEPKPREAARSDLAPAAQSTADAPGALSSVNDPCADRLHALCGPLLYHYALNRRLPEHLDQLAEMAGPDPAVGLDCPVSHRRYVYVPTGFPLGDQPGFVVLHDAEPSHAGFRWAVVVEEPKGRGPQQPLITRVVAVPEPVFLKHAQPPPLEADVTGETTESAEPEPGPRE